jgi:glycosyltransferase involved in cell wall biosynthesis
VNICIVTEIYLKGGINTFLVSLVNGWPNDEDKFTIHLNQEFPSPEDLLSKTTKNVDLVFYKNQSTRLTQKLAMKQNDKHFGHLSWFFMKIYFLLVNYIFFPIYVIIDIIKFKFSSYDRLLVVNGGHPGGLNCRSAILGWKFSGKRPLSVLSFHSYFSTQGLVRKILDFPIDFLLSRSIYMLISVSHGCLESLGNQYSFRSVPKKVIHNGILNPVIPTQLVNLKESSNSRYCIMLGTLEPHKGHKYLLLAFKHVAKALPDIELHMYGDGSVHDHETITNEINNLKLQNRAFLHSFRKDITGLIYRSSVLLVPSQSHESFGITMIEAMSLGVPIVATNVGGIPEVLGSNIGFQSPKKAGIVCDKDDPIQFGNAILLVLSDRKMAYEMGLAGRKRFVEKFTNIKMSQQYYSTLL